MQLERVACPHLGSGGNTMVSSQYLKEAESYFVLPWYCLGQGWRSRGAVRPLTTQMTHPHHLWVKTHLEPMRQLWSFLPEILSLVQDSMQRCLMLSSVYITNSKNKFQLQTIYFTNTGLLRSNLQNGTLHTTKIIAVPECKSYRKEAAKNSKGERFQTAQVSF